MKTLEVNGARLATVDRGTGLPVVLVHGFPLDHTMWDAQVEALSPHYRVIAPDLRGFGRSGVTEGKVTMEQLADDLAAMLDALGVDEPVVFCGLSMGGYVAWQFWRKYAARVRALVLCDTRAIADAPDAAAGRLEAADRVLREGPGPLAEAMIPKLLPESSRKRNRHVAESLRRVILGAQPQGIAAAARGMAERPDVTSMLGQIDCPTLVLVGRLDRISTPEEMREIADAIPGARLVPIGEAGHMSPMENPKEVNAALLAFLEELTR
jgi:pimeloyl-ACP methyl ester carboxylesterase